MLENLKIALKRRKKLIFIFLLTIFITAITLSIFGVIAIRNEQFRRAEQIENEHRRAAEYLRAQTSTLIADLENDLMRLAQNPAFVQKSLAEILDLTAVGLTNQKLVEEAFLFYKVGTREYPLFSPVRNVFSSDMLHPWRFIAIFVSLIWNILVRP